MEKRGLIRATSVPTRNKIGVERRAVRERIVIETREPSRLGRDRTGLAIFQFVDRYGVDGK